MSGLEFHPLANIFPLLEGKQFTELVQDIKSKGLIEPITVFDGKILDGRNRQRACEAAGIEPRFDEAGGIDPLAFVVSKNLMRRNLLDSQRAMIAARLANAPRGRNQHWALGTVTMSEAAQLLNVRERSVNRAAALLKRGVPELHSLVEGGRCSVSAAEVVSRLPKQVQAEIIDGGVRKIVAEAHRKKANRAGAARQQYAELWARIDRVCAALEASRIDQAHIAARELVRLLEAAAAEERK